MTVFFQSGYVLPSSDQPLTHARIAHAGNWFSDGAAEPGNTAAGFDPDAPLNTLTYERWKPSSLPSTWAYNNGTEAVECNYCCIGAHNMGTSGNKLQVQYFDGSVWQAGAFANAVPDDSAIMVIFEPTTAAQWRIRISEGVAPEIGVVKFGKALQMERAISSDFSPMKYNRNVTMRANQSATGEILGRTKVRTNETGGYSWNVLTSEWVYSNWPAFQEATETEPFFIAWRPGIYHDVAFGTANASPTANFSGSRNFMSASVSMTGYIGG